MLLMGIDLGTSSVKIAVVDAATQQCLATAHYPSTEAPIIVKRPGFAEQSPESWWDYTVQAIHLCHARANYDPADIGAIGISYQMHGLVLVDDKLQVLRDAIIWCDSRAVATGDEAFRALGNEFCLEHLLNSPGNFTASKLAWVAAQEPELFSRIRAVLLPGDYIGLRLTGGLSTTPSALSEGIFWDFKSEAVSRELLSYFKFDPQILPSPRPVFSIHGEISREAAKLLSLKDGVPVSYKAGDQLNNAFSLQVNHPGDVAATAGTSGVLYGVSDEARPDPLSRVNSFAHVNHRADLPSIGVLLCINGAGSANRWMKNLLGNEISYQAFDALASQAPAGSDGLILFPFGNGAERMLHNRNRGAGLQGLDLNLHTASHMARAVQEGVAFAFRYGLDIMRSMGIKPGSIRAGHANMFLSDIFCRSFADITGVELELHDREGCVGAALGAGVGAGFFNGMSEAFRATNRPGIVEPERDDRMETSYLQWKRKLEAFLKDDQIKR